jgi:hypothetical protein
VSIKATSDKAPDLGTALAKALLSLGESPATERQRRLAHFSPDVQVAIVRIIELSPVLAEQLLDLADAIYSDGVADGYEA